MIKWTYITNKDNSARYTLGEIGESNLICIGINPSTATPVKLDTTLKRVKRIADINGYDGWIMLNVYPQRDTYPENIDSIANLDIIQDNNKAIKNILRDYELRDIWAGWGVEITSRDYLKNCLFELYENFDDSFNWLHYGDLTNDGHPRHPSRMSYSDTFKPFGVENYIKKLKQK
ncbi:DUF1643 domain-containing protein [Seonamhaeicola marinus]|uniref:DUF1643 domain-containing protein n=1 Tax=Seonamhaeicola marinus TaxID=1912246 RepID=A0A5D0HL05_9FLAO|nr:DUF1643 domain-containing protein [Seonamhaeicola marinus]TYA69982.1 DUF1643 domain-containing protein [Seonamhaeicola marinus]